MSQQPSANTSQPDDAAASGDRPSARPAPAESVTPESPRRRRISLAIMLVVILVIAGVGSWMYIGGLNIEETDDAFIAADTYQVAPRIAGRLRSVLVKDNQVVAAGDPIAEIESDDERVSVDRAKAALELAGAQRDQAKVQVDLVDASTAAGVAQEEAEVAAAEAKLEQERAELESAKAEAQRARSDLDRYSKLSEQAVSQQRLDLIRSTATSTASSVRAAEKAVASGQADVAAAQSKLAAAQADRKRVDAARAEVHRWEAECRQAEAVLHQAELSLSYTKIVAPVAGRVTSKSAEPGDYVREGRTLLILVPENVWVVANFKETQLRDMQPGQEATVHVDAYDLDLRAKVDSVQAGSGAQFSLLPPQNATGNYVKVVQRVPVKIVFDDPEQLKSHLLGPGMSVVPKVHTR